MHIDAILQCHLGAHVQNNNYYDCILIVIKN